MNPNSDDPRKKQSSYSTAQISGLKHVPSANSLIGGAKQLDKKHSEGLSHMVGLSKEKQNDKLLNLDRKAIIKHTTEYEDDKTRKNSNALNFKALSKCITTTSTNTITEKRKERKEKQTRIEQRVEQQKEVLRINEGISIQFNIQNMIQTKKSQAKNESDRSNITNDDKERRRQRPDKVRLPIKQKKKKQKVNQFGLDDFECEEVLDAPQKSTRVHPSGPVEPPRTLTLAFKGGTVQIK